MEELFKGVTQHWMLIMGPVIVLIALAGKNGFSWVGRLVRRAPAQERP
jgi:branched-chain amino acid transport system permease protein